MMRAIAGLMTVVGLLVGTAHAGTISMQVSCRADGTNLLVQLMNRGDEAAQNVSAHIAFRDTVIETPPIASLAPNAPMSSVLGLPSGEVVGTFPAVVTVHFEDLNAYPFSSVTILPVRMGVPGQSALHAALSGGKIRGQKTLRCRVRSQSDQALEIRGRVVMARELVTETPDFTLSLAPNGRDTVSIPVENFSAMPASKYAVHVVLEYDLNGAHYTTVATTPVQVFPSSPFRSVVFWGLVVVVVAGLGLSVFWGRRKSA
jgi:hypothetical protein